MTDKLTESAPPTIWLQVDTDGDADDRSEPLSDWSDTTWCSESIGGQEVEYTRSDIAAAEIARLTAERKVPEWQPIETAPKDGRRVLLGSHTHTFTGKHADGIWIDDAGQLRDPTHWMPLPAAPKVTP